MRLSDVRTPMVLGQFPTTQRFRRLERSFIGFCFLLLSALSARAADELITFPLQGYYHPGRYMPIHVRATPKTREEADGQLCLTASGSVWTFIRYEGGSIDTVVPWLPVDARAQFLSYRTPPGPGFPVELPLKAVDEHTRIVGYSGVSSEEAVKVAAIAYGTDPVIPLPLNPAQPLPGIGGAWEALDAVVLDAATAAHLDEQRQFGPLVASGTAFFIRATTEHPAFPNWPWKRTPDKVWWSLHQIPSGPRSMTYDESVYLPVAQWRSGWATVVRRRFLLAAVIYSLLILGLALWRPRFVAVYALCLAVACAGALAFWGRWHTATLTVGSKVRVVSPGLTQDDDWAYQTSHVTTASLIRWVDTTRPIFASADHLDSCTSRVVCYPNGDPDFIFVSLHAGAKIAYMARHAGPQAHTVTPNLPVTSPIFSLVKERYLSPGDQVLGELPSGPVLGEAYYHEDQWPAVVLRRGEGGRQ